MGINDRLRLIVADHDANPTLGRLLRAEREKAGVEQGELAEAIGITRQALSTWENDKVVPPRGMVIAIAFLLGSDFRPLDEAHRQVARHRHSGSRSRGKSEPGVIHRNSVRYRPIRPKSLPLRPPPSLPNAG